MTLGKFRDCNFLIFQMKMISSLCSLWIRKKWKNVNTRLSIAHLVAAQSIVAMDNNIFKIICLWHRQKLCGCEAAIHLHGLGRRPGQWVSFLDQPTYINVLQRHWQMGHENTNIVPRGRHAAKCYTGLSMLKWARKNSAQHTKSCHWEIPPKFLTPRLLWHRIFELLCLRSGPFLGCSTESLLIL